MAIKTYFYSLHDADEFINYMNYTKAWIVWLKSYISPLNIARIA